MIKYELIEAPEDLPTIIVNVNNGHIVWSTDGNLHQLRYGLSIECKMRNVNAVIERLSDCLKHSHQCKDI